MRFHPLVSSARYYQCISALLLLILVSTRVFCEDLTVFHADNFDNSNNEPVARPSKFVDVNTNHEYLREVSRHYGNTRRYHRHFQKVPTLQQHEVSSSHSYGEKVSQAQPEDTYLDRIDFHYPSVDFSSENSEGLESDFGTISDRGLQNKSRFVFLQSQKVIDNADDNKEFYVTNRPKFKTQIKSYVQKIPKLTSNSTENKNRYEEMSMASTRTKTRINNLLKRYLAKLYSQKYNGTVSGNSRPNSFSKLSPDSENAKTKYFDGSALWNLKNKTVNKIKKLFSLFTIVQFNHTQCNTTNPSGTYQGICYTASECSTIGGTAIGDCANGYGVCCVFTGTCGGSANQNCSYFESPNYPDYYPSDGSTVAPTTDMPPASTDNPSPTPDPRLTFIFHRSEWARQSDNTLSCIFSVYKVNDNISKMRIDFLDLELTGPTDGTCSNERLVISGQNTNSEVPVICGYNTGQHVYVDVSSLSGPLQLSVLAAMSSRKRFRIRICQFEDSCMEPSSNCLQYYTGATGVISSFNYNQASMLIRSVPGYFATDIQDGFFIRAKTYNACTHLVIGHYRVNPNNKRKPAPYRNNLNYAICIRREEGYCSITYRNVVNGMEYPFQFTNVDDSGDPLLPPGQAGADILNCPDDYIVIGNTRLCGDRFNDGAIVDDFTMNADVTDTGAGPIVIPVRTDSMTTGLGFELFYTQIPCMTTF